MMETIKSWFWYIVSMGIFLAVFITCTDTLADKYIGEGNVYEKQLHRKMEILNQARLKSDKVRDSLYEDNKKKDNKISKLRLENNTLEGKITDLKKSTQKKITKSKNYTYKESAEFISKVYGMPRSVSYSDKGVTMADSLPNKVIETYIEHDMLGEQLAWTEGKLENKELESKLLEEKVENKDKEIKSIVEVSAIKDTVIAASQDLNNTYRKENKKLKTSNLLTKGLVVVAFIAGLLITK